MIIQFKDRVGEFSELQGTIKSKRFELVIIYGRRRIGKTELILNATKNKKRIYYLASEENNLERFYRTCLKLDKEAGKLKKDWEVLFDFLKDKADVIVIDEFQNMIHENKSILNTFQSIVDLTLKNSNTKLFLLGSSISMMTSKVLSYKSPLYGRRTGSIDLKAIPFFELQSFFPNASAEQLIEIYGFADGIPFYLVKIDKKFWNWMQIELKKKQTFLKDEVNFLMKYEFDDASTYKLILEAISNGNTKLNEIKNFIKVKRTDITPYLKNLIETGFIKRIVPITENTKSRKGLYFISDNFLKFWFKFIYPNISAIEEKIFDETEIKMDYSSYLGFVFEEVCRQFLIKTKPIEFGKIGKWWHKDKEIDIVALNRLAKQILCAECKWQSKVNAKKIVKELSEKTKHLKWNNQKRIENFVVFAKSFSKKTKEFGGKKVYCFDLKDIEKELKKRH